MIFYRIVPKSISATQQRKVQHMKTILKATLPKQFYYILKGYYYNMLKFRYLKLGRPVVSAETSKAKQRRLRDDFFEKYCTGKGLDIGYGGDLIVQNATGWDFEHGDAQSLNGVPDNTFDFVYSSHTLEHMENPETALMNWWRVLKPGGFLILYIPERDLYEKKKTLPSNWNLDHKHFFLLDEDEEPCTIGILPLIRRSLPNSKIEYAKACNEGHTIIDPSIHSVGEYSIETVIKKEGV